VPSRGSAFERSGKKIREQSGRSPDKGRRGDPLAHRSRWILAAAVLLGWAGVVAGVQAPDGLANAGDVKASVPQDVASKWQISELSQGAPAGAITLANAPTTGKAQPAAATVVSGLAANGIPNVALNAYRVAAARMDTAQPGCGIDWSLLAGIGRVESNHGRFGGAVLNSDGTSTPEIRGPALDGNGFAFIGDSDNGAYDHDSSYDRAVGPMQFIPTTWRSYAIDADGNHTTDPFDIDDAALGAAHYLCVAGGNLTTHSGQVDAVMAYNHSDSYVAEVLALAHAYASGIPVADLPILGNTVGPVPPPSGFYLAPASPGPAIGARDMTPASGKTVGARPSAGGSSGSGGTAAGQPASPAGTSGGGTSSAADGGTAPTSGTGDSSSQPDSQPPASAASDPLTSVLAPPPVVSNPTTTVPTTPTTTPTAPTTPPTTTKLIEGVTCNVLGNLVPDIPGLPPC
jgi:hypothetical protein